MLYDYTTKDIYYFTTILVTIYISLYYERLLPSIYKGYNFSRYKENARQKITKHTTRHQITTEAQR